MRSRLFLSLVVLPAFLAGFGLGAFWSPGAGRTSQRDRSAVRGESSGLDAPRFNSQEGDLKNHVADVERQLVDLKEKEDAAILSDRLAFFKKYHLAPQAFNDDLKVDQAMADFLRMSDPERKAVEDHLAQTFAQIKTLEQQHIKLTRQGNDSVTYEISPYPEGKALKDQLKDVIEGDLGPDRGNLFLESSRWEFSSNFQNFGTGNTEIQVTRTDQSGAPSYRLKETFGDGSGMERSIGDRLPSRYDGLIQLDPSP